MAKKPQNRTAEGRFKRGQSGNPGGRPRAIVALQELARQHAAEAFQRIIALVGSEDERVALSACQIVIERGYGKPTQHIEAAVNLLDKLSDAEYRALVAALEALPGSKG